MQVAVAQRDPVSSEYDALIVPLTKGETVPRHARAIDAATGGAIASLLASGDFGGSPGEVARLAPGDTASKRVFLVGLGAESDVTAERVRRAAAAGVRAAMKRSAAEVGLVAPTLRRVQAEACGQALAEGAVLGAYRFDKYRTMVEDPPSAPESLELLADRGRAAALRKGARLGSALGESANFARDLSNEPGSVHTPVWMADQARKLGRELGLRVRVMTERELEQRNMGGLLAVGRGSANPPRMIVIEHNAPEAQRKGGRKKGRKKATRRRPTVALVGKGITFDSGGISLKPAAAMDEMKHDMSGAAAVFGAMRACAVLNVPLHVVGIVPAAQNMPDGKAYLPGDVVETSNGKTIEVLNTDAEGRIVLADGLHLATSYEPAAIVDLATLTGACVIALGSACAAVMGNDDGLVGKIRDAGERSGDRAWPMPLWDEHKDQIKSHIADIKNTGGREAGSLTAGAFLSHFVGDVPWAHLDIAGTAWVTSDKPTCVKGATGYGVRLLMELLRSWR